jgi:hypothetical protein
MQRGKLTCHKQIKVPPHAHKKTASIADDKYRIVEYDQKHRNFLKRLPERVVIIIR